MEIEDKEFYESILERLDFVNWDRYFGEGENLIFFGWIDREDSYKDFVVLDFSVRPVWFATSSKEYSEKIGEILEHRSHSDCNRIEYSFDIENVIKLKTSENIGEKK